jgi:hypothetical protein
MKIGKLIGYNEVTKNMEEGYEFLGKPFKFFYSTVDDVNYEDYGVTSSSLVNIDTHWKQIGTFQQIRPIMSSTLIGEIGPTYSGWGALSSEKKVVACKWVLAPYALRMTAISDSQDYDYFQDLLEQTSGTLKQNMIGRLRTVEEMRQYIGLGDYRKDILTKNDIDDLYSCVSPLISRYVSSNDPVFIRWLNSTYDYTITGYSSKSYFSQTTLDNLNIIYGGFY